MSCFRSSLNEYPWPGEIIRHFYEPDTTNMTTIYLNEVIQMEIMLLAEVTPHSPTNITIDLVFVEEDWQVQSFEMPKWPNAAEWQALEGVILRSHFQKILWRDPRQRRSILSHYLDIDYKIDEVTNSLEACVILMYSLWTNRDRYDQCVVAVLNYCKCTGVSPSSGIVLVTAYAAFSKLWSKDQVMEVQGLVFEDMRTFVDGFERLRISPLFNKLYTFGMYALALNLFSGLGVDMDVLKFSETTQRTIRKNFTMNADFLHCMMDTVTFLCERGYQCFASGTMQPMFHSEARYQAWFDKAEKLSLQATLMSNPNAHKLDRSAFQADLTESVELGKSMKKLVKGPEKVLLSKLLSNLELLQAMEITRRSAQQVRQAPFSLLVYGGSSIGKSSFLQVLFQQYGKVMQMPTSTEFMYTRNPTEEFWSNFTTDKWCVVMDDIAFQAPQLGTMDPSLAELLCVVNNVPFVPAQAELSDKGRTPVRAKLVIGTTNTADLNLHSYFSCPLAVQRRFPFVIDLRPKEEYSKNSGTMLDGTKVPVDDSVYPDLWNILVKKVVPAGEERNHQRGLLVDVQTFTNIDDFLEWYSKEVVKHVADQDKVTDSMAAMSKIEICPICYRAVAKCNCELQADILIEDVVPYVPDMPNFLYNEGISLVSCTLENPTPYMKCVMMWFGFLYYFNQDNYLGTFVKLLFGEYWFWNMVVRSRFRNSLCRTFIKGAGRYVYRSFNPKPVFMKIATFGSVLLGAYLFLKRVGSMFEVQGQSFSFDCSSAEVEETVRAPVPTSGVPAPDVDIRPTVSYVNEFQISTADLSQASLCAKNDPSIVEKHLEASVVVFHSSGDKVRSVLAMNVRGNVYVCNSHGLPASGDFFLTVVGQVSNNINTNVNKILITENLLWRHPTLDLVFVRLLTRPPGSDLTKYFVTEAYTGKIEGKYFGRTVDGRSWKREISAIVPHTTSWLVHGERRAARVWMGKTKDPTVMGDCGAPLLAYTPAGPMILGVHTLGSGLTVGAMRLDREILDLGLSKLESNFVSRGFPKISAPSAERVLSDLSVQSVVHSSNPGTANVMGTFAGYRVRGKTSVTKTFIHDAVSALGFTTDKVAPDMGKRPWRVAIDDMTRPVTLLDSSILEKAKLGYIADTSHLKTDRIMVYDDVVAVNGAMGVRYCDKMNRKSSAGCPYKKSKKTFLEPYFTQLGDDMVMPVQEIKDRMKEIIDTYKRGERWHPVFCGHLKDEPVTQKKFEAGKTRVFTSSPMAWTIVVRKYLLSVIVFMQNNRTSFECGPGTVAQSLEWEQIREFLVEFGIDQIVAGDYGKFDKRMPAMVILAAFDVLIQICKIAGYTDEDIQIIRGIAVDTAYPNVDYNGDLIEFFGGNPSGHPLTVIINGIANCIYMRYCYTVLNPLKDCTTFRSNVHLMTYGDDNVMGISKSCPWFNHTSIQRVLALVDIEYTMANKEEASRPYDAITTVSFLKREFRWDADIGAFVAPLCLDSISKMLLMCVQSKNISSRHHAMAVIQTAIREMFFHGRDAFDNFVEQMHHVVDRCDLELYVSDSTFPTWETLYTMFWASSKHVKLVRYVPQLDRESPQFIVGELDLD